MERFVPCQVTDKINCVDCVFREKGLDEINRREGYMIKHDGFGFTDKDTKQPSDEMSKKELNTLNICAEVTGKKYIVRNNTPRIRVNVGFSF